MSSPTDPATQPAAVKAAASAIASTAAAGMISRPADLGPELSAKTNCPAPSLLSREDDPVARDVVEDLARVQTSVPVAWWTLSSFFDVASQEPDLSDWADSMRARYADDLPRE